MSVEALHRTLDRQADRDERMAAARRALHQAETATGMRTRLSGPTALRPAQHERAHQEPVQAGHARADARSSRGTGFDVARPGPQAFRTPTAEDHLPVPGALVPLFPGGGLRRGSVVQVSGSTSLLLALAAAAGQDGAWSALTAMPDVGLQAAAEAGLALERVVMVPRPGPDAPAVLGALVDGFDVLVVGDCRALTDRDRRLVGSRLRAREAVLLSTRPWPGSDLVLEVSGATSPGTGTERDLLGRREMTVRALGRGASGRGGQVRVSIGADGLRRVGESPAPAVLTPVTEPADADLLHELRAV